MKCRAYHRGSGSAMVLIHGVGMNASFWDNIAEPLAQHFALSVVDLPGHGESPNLPPGRLKPGKLKPGEPKLSDYTDAVAETIDQPAIIVGHSMGALIALDLAVRYTNITAGIAVLNGIYRRDEQASRAVQARAQELDTSSVADPTDTLSRWFGSSPVGINAQAARHCRAWLEAINPAGYARAYHAFASADAPSDDDLQCIRCPALFITGSDEPNSTPAMSRAMSQLLPDAKCVIVENARHMLSLTHGPETTRSIVDFFKRT